MKKYYTLFFFLLPGILYSQIFSAISNRSNSSVLNLMSNPANVRTDSLFTWDANLLSVNAWGGGTNASLSIKQLKNINNNFLRENILGISLIASGTGILDITGPTIAFKIGKKSSMAFGTRVRMFSNFWNVDGRLVSEIGEDTKEPQDYPYNIYPSKNMQLNAAMFSDISLSYTQQIFESGLHSIKAGLTLKYLTGMSHASIDVKDLNGRVGLTSSAANGAPYLTAASGQITTRSSGDLFTDIKLGSFTSALIGKGNIGADVGLVYEYKTEKRNQRNYLFKIGISITDIGKVNYYPDSLYSRSYNIHISPSNALFFNNNFQNSSFAHTSEVYDKYPGLFTQTSTQSSKYKIGLPTTLRAYFDASIDKGIYVSGDLIAGLQKGETVTALCVYNAIALIPRYEKGNFSISLPISYQGYTHAEVGLGINIGPFYIGSGSLIADLLGKTKQLDAFMGLRIDPAKRKNQIVSDKSKTLFIPIVDKKITQALINENKSTPLQKLITSNFSIQTIATTSNIVPFWIRSNQYGSVPLSGASISAIGRIVKNYDTARKAKLLDWGMGLEGRINAGTTTEGILTEAFAKARISIFELNAGRSKNMTGVADSELSVGNFSISGNALGVPKIELGTKSYWTVPFVRWLAFKGSVAHGWFGETPLVPDTATSKIFLVNSYYHQSFFYARIGNEGSKIKLTGGINHQVMWGHEKEYYIRNTFNLTPLETFWYVFLGEAYGSGSTQGALVPRSKIGNHLGSIDQAIELNFKKYTVNAYHEFFYDVGGLSQLANVKDGLFGLSIINKGNSNQKSLWKKMLFEFLSSKSQGGEIDAPLTASGAENYYNNYQYIQGWTYKGANLGTPMLTNAKYLRANLQFPNKTQTIANNRVYAFHFAAMGQLSQVQYKIKLTLSKNFGTYDTSPDNARSQGPPYFGEVNQFSSYLEANKQLKNGYKIGGVFALDAGKLLYNSAGFILKLSKSFK